MLHHKLCRETWQRRRRALLPAIWSSALIARRPPCLPHDRRPFHRPHAKAALPADAPDGRNGFAARFVVAGTRGGRARRW